ncbi:MAG: hypothetical protein JXA69_16340 [Phycisphaerae bacterium]|nr:hypothetical protein [Phycisphaerae bacterium]
MSIVAPFHSRSPHVKRSDLVVTTLTLTALAILPIGSCAPADGDAGATHTITVTVNPADAGTVAIDPPEDPFAAGQQVTLTATPAAGFEFDRWQGDVASTTNPLQVTVNGDLQIEAVFLATAGGDNTDTGGSGGADPDGGLNENRQVLSDSIEVVTDDDGHTTLTGSDIPASIAPGSLLISTRGDGKLLRVTSTPIVSGDQVIVETEQAALTDLIRNGTLQLSIPFEPDNAVIEMPAAFTPADMKRVRFYRTADQQAALSFTNHEISLDEWGKVSLDQLTIEFDPDFDITATIEGSQLQHLRCTAGTGFHLGLDVTIEAAKISELISKDTTIGKVKWPDPCGIMVIAGVPVVYQVFLEVKVGAQVTFGDVGTITAGLDFDADATLGAEYTKGEGWNVINDKTVTFTPHTPEWGVSPITAQVFVKPEFGIKFFGVVGPSLSWKEYIELAGAYKYDVIGAELARGSQCDFHITFKIIDGMPSYKYSHNLFKARQVLLARMLADADPTDLGSASLSPDDLAWGLYAFTQSLDATAQADTGYEVAGWTIRNLVSSGGETVHATELHDQPVDGSKLFVAGIVPEGQGDTWTGAGTGSGSPTYSLTTEVFPSDGGEIMLFPGGGLYQYGVNVLAAPKPTSRYEFHHWEGALSGDGPTGVVKMTSNKSVRAVFASNPPRTLYVPRDYLTLQDALNAATYNDIIHIEAGTHAGPGFHDITILRDHIVIEGAGADVSIIDLGDAAQLGWLDDVHITFQNLQIYRGSGDLGGALRLTGDTTATFKNCTFRSCNARNGGAVYVSDVGTIVSFENCRFESNHATSSGGALNLSNTPKDEEHVPILTGCTFTSNTADSSGGGIAAGKCQLTGCTFTENHAFTGGGGSFGKEAIVTDCTFTTNTAQNGGGASADEYSSFHECFFTYNVAERDGGGIKAGNGVSIENSMLDNNQAGEDGGAIYANRVSAGKTLFIVGCSLSENSAGENGGGVRCDGTEVSQIELIANTAGQRGGGIYATYSQISSGYIVGNRAGTGGNSYYSEGGGIYLQQTNVSNCQLTSNEAIDGNGGGIYAQGSLSDTAVPPVISDVYAAFNTAKNGGGIGSDLEVYILSSSFEDNQASYRGGGIYAERGPLVSLCWIEHNEAPEAGGARVSEGSVLSSTILRNEATGTSGGGLHLFKSLADNCTVSHNTAVIQGGGICTGVDCSISNCTVTYNALTDTTSTGGGGIHCGGSPVLTGLNVHDNTPTNCNSDCPCP